jgi:hypothetical protein
MIHHVTLEVDERLIAEEWRFWGVLGYYPTRPPSRAGGWVHWLVNTRARQAIELLPSPQPAQGERCHIAVVVGDFDRTLRRLAGDDAFEVRELADHLGCRRAWTMSPSGNMVKLMSRPVNVKSGVV